jgi:hypothetical protein
MPAPGPSLMTARMGLNLQISFSALQECTPMHVNVHSPVPARA